MSLPPGPLQRALQARCCSLWMTRQEPPLALPPLRLLWPLLPPSPLPPSPPPRTGLPRKEENRGREAIASQANLAAINPERRRREDPKKVAVGKEVIPSTVIITTIALLRRLRVHPDHRPRPPSPRRKDTCKANSSFPSFYCNTLSNNMREASINKGLAFSTKINISYSH